MFLYSFSFQSPTLNVLTTVCLFRSQLATFRFLISSKNSCIFPIKDMFPSIESSQFTHSLTLTATHLVTSHRRLRSGGRGESNYNVCSVCVVGRGFFSSNSFTNYSNVIASSSDLIQVRMLLQLNYFDHFDQVTKPFFLKRILSRYYVVKERKKNPNKQEKPLLNLP